MKFSTSGMLFWQYYNMGDGKFIPFSQLTFNSGLSVIEAFGESCFSAKVGEKKIRKDRSMFLSKMCTEPGCVSTFETDELQEHIHSRNHEFSSNKTSIDYVKSYFADFLQTSSHQSVSVTNDVTVIKNTSDCMLMEGFQKPGWAIPKRQVVRFSFDQRMYLYSEFMAGEKSGKKITPDKVV